ncbi:MAG: universal stress protein [Myxococcota bacterium]|nr:universal stress protein [Myxococcota bacterium]
MNRILVLTPPEDRGGRAVTLAADLARRSGARVTLLRALEESLIAPGRARDAGSERALRDLLVEAETRRVGELAERFRAGGTEVRIEVRWGPPSNLVLDLVEHDGYDMVVKPATGMGRQGPVFFGFTALHLFRRCPCPVWVVGDGGRQLPSKIMAAVDPMDAPVRRASAHRILDWAERVAGWSEGTVHVAAAWYAPAAELLREDLSEREWKAYVDDARARTEADFDAFLADRPAPVVEARRHLLEGEAQDALPRFAESEGVELIVMGTRGRSDASGDLLGETAETTIRQVRSSVLTIPPKR